MTLIIAAACSIVGFGLDERGNGEDGRAGGSAHCRRTATGVDDAFPNEAASLKSRVEVELTS